MELFLFDRKIIFLTHCLVKYWVVPVRHQVAGTGPAHEATVEGAEFSWVRAPRAGAGEPPVVKQELLPPGLAEVEAPVPGRDLLSRQDPPPRPHLDLARVPADPGDSVGQAAVVQNREEEVEASPPHARDVRQGLPVNEELLVTQPELLLVPAVPHHGPPYTRHFLINIGNITITLTKVKQTVVTTLRPGHEVLLGQHHPRRGEPLQQSCQLVGVPGVSGGRPGDEVTLEAVM